MYENSDFKLFEGKFTHVNMDIQKDENVRDESSQDSLAESMDHDDFSDKENSSVEMSDLQNVINCAEKGNYAPLSTSPDKTESGSNSRDEQFSIVPSEKETPLFVTCGPNKAVLYLERLERGSKGASILFEDWWLTPNEFQKISGRGTAKDWKRSIKHHGRSLKLLMAKGLLFLGEHICKCDYCISEKANRQKLKISESDKMEYATENGGRLAAETNSEDVNVHIEQQEMIVKETDTDSTNCKESHSLISAKPHGNSENVEIKDESTETTGSVGNYIGKDYSESRETDKHLYDKDPLNETPLEVKASYELSNLQKEDNTPFCAVETLADSTEKVSDGKMGGNHPGQNDADCLNEKDDIAAVKLTSLTPGNPENGANGHQKLTNTCDSTLSQETTIKSPDKVDGADFENPIKYDKCDPSPSTGVAAELSEEIRLPLKMEFPQEEKHPKAVNSATESNNLSGQAEEIDGANPLLSASLVESHQADGFSTSGDNLKRQQESPRSPETPPYIPAIPVTNCMAPAPLPLGIVSLDNPNEVKTEGTPSSHPTQAAPVIEGDSLALSPRKEARLINIIEELKHYKKCLEVQIQAQKCLSGIQQSPQTTTKVPFKSSLSPKLRSSYGHKKMYSDVMDKEDKDATVTDHSSHATGTVHWGVPKGYNPSHISPNSTVMTSYQTLNNNVPSCESLQKNKTFSYKTTDVKRDSYKNNCKGSPYYSCNKYDQQLNSTHMENKLPKMCNGNSSNRSPKSQQSFSTKNLSNNNNEKLVPTVDTNAYFIYLSECLKRGQMPNMYGYFQSISKTISSPKAETTCESPSKVIATSSKRSYESHPDEHGVLDLSFKKQKGSHQDCTLTNSREVFVTDQYGALDLSKKTEVKN